MEDELLTAAEVAQFLRVPLSWVYERCRVGAVDPLPHLKLGKYLRFRKTDLLAFVNGLRRGDSRGLSRKA
jgi:hypothetical protein